MIRKRDRDKTRPYFDSPDERAAKRAAGLEWALDQLGLAALPWRWRGRQFLSADGAVLGWSIYDQPYISTDQQGFYLGRKLDSAPEAGWSNDGR